MKLIDITVSIINAIEEKIYKEWRHEGCICNWASDRINVIIDNKKYLIRLYEVDDGEHWSENGR